MGLSLITTACPEPCLMILLNLSFPGLGTMFSAYFGKSGFSFMTFGAGFAMNFVWNFLIYFGSWLFFPLFLCIPLYLFNMYLSYLLFRASVEKYSK